MLVVVIGITYGSMLGFIGQLLLYRHMEENRRNGQEPLKGIGGVFLTRFLVDVVGLILFALVTRHGLGIVAACLSVTIAVKISLFVTYARKGGRID